jgi:hypothetical protein
LSRRLLKQQLGRLVARDAVIARVIGPSDRSGDR